MSTNTKDNIYQPMSKEVLAKERELNILTQKNLEKNFFAKFFDEKINENLQKKWLTFGCRRSTKSKHHKKTLSSKQKKELKIFHIEPEVQKFQHFIPLHKLWKQYMKTLVQFGNVNVNNLAAVHLKVLKADYHGCYLTVSKSKCPSYVGTSGIVIMESKNIFKIITKDDKLKRVPKKNSIFSFSLEGYCFTLYGNHMKVKSSERSHRKFKNKPTIDL
ncbi:ribonuclease P protein subunit p29-like [Argonauta hians]